MKLAAARALAALAKEDVPDSVIRAYGGEPIKFGRDYLIPKPFDYRVLLWEAPAVAEAAIRTGVARKPYSSREDYVRELENRLSRTRQVMHVVIDQAEARPEAHRLPRGRGREDRPGGQDPGRRGHLPPRAARRPARIDALLAEHEVAADTVEVVDPATDERTGRYAEVLHSMRWRNGVTAMTAPR